MKRPTLITVKTAVAALMVTAVGLFTGCRNEGGPWEEEVLTYDIVRLASQDKSTGTTFTLTLPDDDRLITYTVNHQTIDTTRVKVGDRLMLAYRLGGNRDPYTSGAIIPVGYSPINNANLTVTEDMAEEYGDWDRDPIYLMSMWRSETCINLHFRLTFSDKKRTFALVMDESEADAEIPTLYVAHTLADGEYRDNFEREGYASFDIDELWGRESCRGVTVTINNSNLPKSTFTFMK